MSRFHKVTTPAIGLLSMVTIALLFREGLRPHSHEFTSSAHEHESSQDARVGACTVPNDGHTHGHSEGVLTAIMKNGKVTEWNCSFGTHHTCTSSNGASWTCTFPPDLMPFPNPVSEEARANPEKYMAPPIEEPRMDNEQMN